MDEPLKDIYYLLQLEAIKRAKDEVESINKVIAEKHKEYLEVQNSYIDLFSAYVDIIIECFTLTLLSSKAELSAAAQLAETTKSLTKTITNKTTAALSSFDYVEPSNIKRTQEILAAKTNNENIEQYFNYTLSSSNLKDEIKGTLGRIESKLENAINSGLDSMISKFNINAEN